MIFVKNIAMGFFDFLTKNKDDKIIDFVTRGAIVLDVRTEAEFKMGHIPGSTNIPLQILSSKIEYIKKLNTPIIACCRSGMRSGNAAQILAQNEIEVMNGGGWQQLSTKL